MMQAPGPPSQADGQQQAQSQGPPQQQQPPSQQPIQQQPWMMMQQPPAVQGQQQMMPGMLPPQVLPPPPLLPPQGMMAQPAMQMQPAMLQAQQMMPAQGMMQQQQQQQGSQQSDEVRTLWVGDLQLWMDENYLYQCFGNSAPVQSVKVIRNKASGLSEGYGFVEFNSHAMAESILQTFNGTMMPNADQPFRLNWASFGIGERRPDMGPDFSIFVGDLAPDVTDYMLQETFRSHYPSVKGAKVVMDTTTGRSKGYGFVRFGDESERSRAMTEMNGIYCSSRPMRISTATPKKPLPGQQATTKAPYQGQQSFSPQPFPVDNDPNNTTVFVGGLDQNVTDDDLRQVFSSFGEIVYVKIPVGKGCGFVQFTTRASAEEALSKLHGYVIGQQTIRLSWGRSPANKQTPLQRQAPAGWGQPQPDPNQWNGAAYYGYGQGYEGYGYAPPPQDPAAYGYGNYPAYGTYPQQVS